VRKFNKVMSDTLDDPAIRKRLVSPSGRSADIHSMRLHR
jgi:hypothetical protein